MPMPRRPATIVVLAWCASSAPIADTPTAPPSERMKATSAEPEPMSSSRSEFCTTSTRFCISIPMPIPSTTMKPISTPRCVVSSIVPISSRPVVRSVAPKTMYGL